VLAGHGVGGADVIEGWDVRRFLAVVYYLVTEHMDRDARDDFDAQLASASADNSAPRRLFAALAGGEEVIDGRGTE
jgi:hypothetical protein